MAREKPHGKAKRPTAAKSAAVGKPVTNPPKPPREAANQAADPKAVAKESRVASTASEPVEAANKGAINGPSNRPEPKLTEEARAFVVAQNAHWIAPKLVAAAVKEQFGIVVTPQAIEAYDPTKAAGSGLSAKWKALFEATRKRAIDEEADIAVAHRNVRLRTLARLAAKAESAGNLGLAAQLLRQAAEELGDVYTNARKLTGGGKDGAHVVEGLAALFGAVDGQTRTLAQPAKTP